MSDENILVWLPTPMGDAILSTPALRAMRERFNSWTITFLSNNVVADILTPGGFNDKWLTFETNNPISIAKILRRNRFDEAVLLKNSFSSALAVFLAGIPVRVGYARDGRGIFLTEKIDPPKTSKGDFKPASMIDYYLGITSVFGAATENRKTELLVDAKLYTTLYRKVPQIIASQRPIVILVPGGSFGPSKLWAAERYAQIADWLTEKYNALVIVSVSPNDKEKQIARYICESAKSKPVNLGLASLSLGELKALFLIADLVISNDTGPRHIAIALGRKVITLFGPNNPEWTQTGYENEIQITAKVACSPCDKPVCKKPEHFCMDAITVEMVCQAAEKMFVDRKNYE